jgi:OmcA/MtrC family decaheme c-type cytochrome
LKPNRILKGEKQMKKLNSKWYLVVLCMVLLATVTMLTGCEGNAGPAGATGSAGLDGQDLVATAKPESCAICHGGQGAAHQAKYTEYVNTSLAMTIDNVTSVGSGTNWGTAIQFTVTKNGAPYSASTNTFKNEFDQSTIYVARYDSATRTFSQTSAVSFPTASTTQVGGVYTTPTISMQYQPEDPANNAMVFIYVAKGKIETEGFQLYADVANIGKEYGDVDTYVSTANVSGCEKCHGAPYRKHGYRMAQVTGLPTFAACKVCHLDDKAGGHEGWQLLVDDTARYAELNAQAEASASTSDSADNLMTSAENAKYAYKRNLMNDVHMSHSMEFAYPQQMANCATCHAGKLTSILTSTNFTVTTCRSCHPITAAAGTDAKRAPSLKDIMLAKYSHTSVIDNLYADATSTPVCTTCHDGGTAPVFSTIHTGYNSMIYASDGTKYADAITASVDSASITGNVLDIKFSVAGSAGLLTAASITQPMVAVSMYGYNTKDFILSAHTSDANGVRMEKTIGTANALFTEVATTVANTFEVTLDLASYASVTGAKTIPEMIADGTIKRMEIAVLPKLLNADGVTVGLNAPSKTFDIATNAFVSYYTPIVQATKCNTCHDQLATTFHSGMRGGNVVVCRMCHAPTSGGSHLELQSRSIDSYVHAVHSFQPFDIGDVDFTDPEEVLAVEHHLEATFPNFTILNCEACHVAGTNEVPAQDKSLPGILSGADYVEGRKIENVPSYVTGPATRACGACHRAKFINEDDESGLAAFNAHTTTNGYMIENATGVFDAVISAIFSIFE